MPNVAKREQHYSTNDVFAEIIMTVPNIKQQKHECR